MKDRDYDVIVIGAGNGGLAAAATAVKQGLKTLLVEQHNLPGGFASSFVRGRFEFETALHELCDLGPENNRGGVGQFFDGLGLGVEWVEVPEAYNMIITDGKYKGTYSMPFGKENFISQLESYVPGCRKSIEDFFSLCDDVLSGFVYLVQSKGNADKKILMKEHANFLKTAPYSLANIEKMLKIDPKAQAILNAYWCYIGINTHRVNFTIFAAMIAKYVKLGGFIPKMRSHEISTALLEYVSKNGGEVMMNTKAEKIIVESGCVQGIRIDSGEIISAPNVICNASRHTVYSNMIDNPPERLIRAANTRKIGAKGYVVYMGLNKSAHEIGINEYSYFIYPTEDDKKMEESFYTRKADPIQAITCLNNAIEGCSEEGTCILSVTTLYQGDSWADVTPDNYVNTKNEIANRIIDRLEKVLNVNIREYIEEIEVASPQTFARYTNAYDGSIYGYEADSWDSILPRLMMMSEKNDIDGLRFAGGNAFRAFGYSSSYLSGETAALLVYKQMQNEKNDESDI